MATDPALNPAFSFLTDIDGISPPPPEPTSEPEPEPAPDPDLEAQPEPASPPPLTVSERARLQELEQAQRTAQLEQVQRTIQTEAQEKYDEALKWGWSQAQAQQRGEDHLASRQREVQTIINSMQQQNQQSQVAQDRAMVAREFGITANDLADFNDAQSMRGHARILQQMRRLEASVRRAVPGTPAQSFEGGATEQGAGSSDESILAALGNEMMDPNQLSAEDNQRLLKQLLG